MEYTLITSSGKIMQFYLAATAECYRNLYGGVVIPADILAMCERLNQQ
jgi:hypothetical protein